MIGVLLEPPVGILGLSLDRRGQGVEELAEAGGRLRPHQ